MRDAIGVEVENALAADLPLKGHAAVVALEGVDQRACSGIRTRGGLLVQAVDVAAQSRRQTIGVAMDTAIGIGQLQDEIHGHRRGLVRQVGDDAAHLEDAAGIALVADKAGVTAEHAHPALGDDIENAFACQHAAVVGLDEDAAIDHRVDEVVAEFSQAASVVHTAGQRRCRRQAHRLGEDELHEFARLLDRRLAGLHGVHDLAGRGGIGVAGVGDVAGGVQRRECRLLREARTTQRVIEQMNREDRAQAQRIPAIQLGIDVLARAFRLVEKLTAVKDLLVLGAEDHRHLSALDHATRLLRCGDDAEEALARPTFLRVNVVLQVQHLTVLQLDAFHLIAIVLLAGVGDAELLVGDQVIDHEAQPAHPRALDPQVIGLVVGIGTVRRPVAESRPALRLVRRVALPLRVGGETHQIIAAIGAVVGFAILQGLNDAKSGKRRAVTHSPTQGLTAAQVHVRLGIAEHRAVRISALERRAAGVELHLRVRGTTLRGHEVEHLAAVTHHQPRISGVVGDGEAHGRSSTHFLHPPLRAHCGTGAHRQRAGRRRGLAQLLATLAHRTACVVDGIAYGLQRPDERERIAGARHHLARIGGYIGTRAYQGIGGADRIQPATLQVEEGIAAQCSRFQSEAAGLSPAHRRSGRCRPRGDDKAPALPRLQGEAAIGDLEAVLGSLGGDGQVGGDRSTAAGTGPTGTAQRRVTPTSHQQQGEEGQGAAPLEHGQPQGVAALRLPKASRALAVGSAVPGSRAE